MVLFPLPNTTMDCGLEDLQNLHSPVRIRVVPPSLDANFDTKLASSFLCFCPRQDAKMKSSKVREGHKLHFRMGGTSFQEIERFSVVPREGSRIASGRRFLCSFSQNASTVDDYK